MPPDTGRGAPAPERTLMRNRYIEPLRFGSAPAFSDFPQPITPKVPVLRNSAISMLATCCRSWIVKPMTK